MPTYENRHLLRVLDSPHAVASRFIAYCKTQNVKTRGLCRIGFVTRASPQTTSSTSAPKMVPLRGLIANQDIRKDENIAMMPVSACLHPGAAFRCTDFWQLLPRDARETYAAPSSARNSRVVDRSLIRHTQHLLALYMVYLMLLRAFYPSQLQATRGGDALSFIDFMPRDEGDFEPLAAHLSGWLEAAPICRSTQAALASHFGITQAEIRPALLFALCMIYSRMVPVDHRACLQYAFQETPFQNVWDVDPVDSKQASDSDGSGGGASLLQVAPQGKLVQEPVSMVCPLVDMCNHSEHENVAVMVPDRAEVSIGGPVICLRSLRDIAKGEELTMTYGAAPHELRLIWGMKEILV